MSTLASCTAAGVAESYFEVTLTDSVSGFEILVEPNFKLEGDFVNFWVYYPLDNNLSKHVLEVEGYAWGESADWDSWVLLDKVEEESEEESDESEESLSPSDEEPLPSMVQVP